MGATCTVAVTARETDLRPARLALQARSAEVEACKRALIPQAAVAWHVARAAGLVLADDPAVLAAAEACPMAAIAVHVEEAAWFVTAGR